MTALPSSPTPDGRARAAALDAASPLRGTRERFDLPAGTVYLDGNSLGPLPRGVAERMTAVVTEEWGRGLISSWNTAGWLHLPARVGAKVAGVLGVPAETVWVGDSTTVCLFKALVAAARLRPGRNVLVLERGTFPTDGYVADSVARMLGLELRWVDLAGDGTADGLLAALDERTAVVCLTHVDFRSGAMLDLPAVTGAVHDAGGVMVWDLCHTAGAVPVDLAGAGVELAVGCGYKYLNGGPGAPAFVYADPGLHASLDQPLPGWMGHARPFAMEPGYEPVPGVGRLASGTPPVLALSALDTALDAFDGVDPAALRATSLSLTDYFVERVDRRLGDAVEVVTPLAHDRRGSQVSLRHPDAYGVVQALIARGVVGDFRTPDLARFGFAPLYVSHVDVHDAVEHLVQVLANGEHRRPEYAVRNPVT